MNTKPKILIVDDKPENLVALRTVLQDLEIELVEASSGNEALKATLKHEFALALLDIQMPDMDGYELAEILREEEKTAGLPFIFISAVYTDNLNVFKGYEKGAFSFITKPFHPEILINKVKFFIDKHQQEIALIKMNDDLQGKNLELENMNKELESFSYSISHDLRAPLRSINGFSEVLRQNYEKVLDDEGKHYLKRIVEGGTKMNNLIDCLLNLSRLGRQELKKRNVNMNMLVKGVVHEWANEAGFEKIKWNIQFLEPVSGDETLIRQVYVNLLSNAIKYSSVRPEPEIEIGDKEENGGRIYYIRDNGVGFNMQYEDKLFGVFQRLHGAEEFDGIGIGLAIVKRIITRHGGKVWAEGEPDKGACFYFTVGG